VFFAGDIVECRVVRCIQANLRQKATHSVQTNRSNMRRDNVAQCYPPKYVLLAFFSLEIIWEREEASTHKNAKTHAGNVFVTRDLDLWPFDPKINRLSGLVKHFCVKFGETSSVGFGDIVRKTTQTVVKTRDCRRRGYLYQKLKRNKKSSKWRMMWLSRCIFLVARYGNTTVKRLKDAVLDF